MSAFPGGPCISNPPKKNEKKMKCFALIRVNALHYRDYRTLVPRFSRAPGRRRRTSGEAFGAPDSEKTSGTRVRLPTLLTECC